MIRKIVESVKVKYSKINITSKVGEYKWKM
jgi:hypothetical protein